MNQQIIISGNNFITEDQQIGKDLFERWTSYLDASERTIDTYTKAIRQFYNYLQERGIKAPQREDIIAYREDLKLEHKPTTVQAYLTAVKLFFQWTEAERIYPNVAVHVKGAKLDPTPKKDYLSKNQINTLLSSIDRSSLKGKRDYAMILLMITTGLRTVSVMDADIKDIGIRGDNAVLYYRGKGHEEKATYVNLGSHTEEAIRSYLKERGEKDGSAPLFSSIANRNNDERMTTRSISRVVKDRLIEAGYDSEKLTAHSLRHTAGCQNLLNGGTVEETQQMLDHKSIVTSMIYLHILERDKNKSECRIDSAIFD